MSGYGYPNQPRSQGGWPEQPPAYSPRSGPADRAYPTDDPYYAERDQPGMDHPRQQPRRRRRRGRGWIALFVILIVLAVIFVVGDQIARTYAQNMIASKFQSEGFPVKPAVSIKGWPFLTQVAERDVRTIDISASNVQEDKLDISRFNATASGVHINSGFNSATIDTITGTGLITFSSVANAIGISNATIAADPSAGANVAKVSDGVLNTTAQVTRTGPNKVGIQLQSVEGLPIQVPSYTLTLPNFPDGIQLSGVSVTSQGVVIQVSGHNTTLSQ